MTNNTLQMPKTANFQKETEGYPVSRAINVEWGEMDAAQHVNNTVYLKWFESARVNYLTEMAKHSELNILKDVGLVLSHQECKYIFPVTFPDTVWIAMKVSQILDDRFTMTCKMMSQKHDRIVAIASATLVPYNFKTKQKVPLSQEVIEQIKKVEGE